MLTHPTLDQLRALKLDGMAQAFVELEAQEQARDLAHAEWLAMLLDREAANRNTRRFQTRLRAARLRHSQAAIEDVDYRTPRRLDKALFQQLATCRWIAEHRGLLVTGPCGGANRGYPARSRRKLAATATPSSTPACRACSLISISPTATAASRGCSGCWSRSISSCSTTGDPIASRPASGAISWRSSRTAMAVAPC
jgi:IstB-like ATP binding protein